MNVTGVTVGMRVLNETVRDVGSTVRVQPYTPLSSNQKVSGSAAGKVGAVGNATRVKQRVKKATPEAA